MRSKHRQRHHRWINSADGAVHGLSADSQRGTYPLDCERLAAVHEGNEVGGRGSVRQSLINGTTDPLHS